MEDVVRAGRGVRKRDQMSWYKQAQQQNVKIWNDCYDSHQGESFCSIYADDPSTGEMVGYIDYSVFEDELDIKYVHVAEPYRRQGLGTRMIEFLKQENPETKIRTGLATDMGAPFVQSLRGKGIL
jgi:GNAT superfamily N-acetyltransferase